LSLWFAGATTPSPPQAWPSTWHSRRLAPNPATGTATRRGRPQRRTGHNLLLRLTTRKDDVLRFLPAVPFTNNEAERDGRMMKVRQKISGGFRSQNGASDFAVIRSLIATAKKQGWNVLNTLTQNTDTLLPQLKTA
jgi:transposase